MTGRISQTLEARQNGSRAEICCCRCGHALAPMGNTWKSHAVLSMVHVSAVPGNSSSVHSEVVFRHFSCPKCGTLLDSETALPEDPFLDDVVSA